MLSWLERKKDECFSKENPPPANQNAVKDVVMCAVKKKSQKKVDPS
jgi:uncharacterized protein YneF (UPF0154 family)